MIDHLELAAVLREMLMVRAGEVMTKELAAERANNIAALIMLQITDNGVNTTITDCQLNNCSGTADNSNCGVKS